MKKAIHTWWCGAVFVCYWFQMASVRGQAVPDGTLAEYPTTHWLSSQLHAGLNAGYAGTQARGLVQLRVAHPSSALRGYGGLEVHNRIGIGAEGEARLVGERLAIHAGLSAQNAQRTIFDWSDGTEYPARTTISAGVLAANWRFRLGSGSSHTLRVGAGLTGQYAHFEEPFSYREIYHPTPKLVTKHVVDYHIGAWYTYRTLQAGLALYNIGEPGFAYVLPHSSPDREPLPLRDVRPFQFRWDVAWSPGTPRRVNVMPLLSWQATRVANRAGGSGANRDTTYSLAHDLTIGLQAHILTYGMLGARYTGRPRKEKQQIRQAVDLLTLEAGAWFHRFRVVYTASFLLATDPVPVHILELQARL